MGHGCCERFHVRVAALIARKKRNGNTSKRVFDFVAAWIEDRSRVSFHSTPRIYPCLSEINEYPDL